VMRVMPRLQKLVSSVRSGRNHCGRMVGNPYLIALRVDFFSPTGPYHIRIKYQSGPPGHEKILDTVYLLLIYRWWTYSCLLPIAFQMICSTCSP